MNAETRRATNSPEWLEQQSPQFRWAATEVMAIYGDQVINPSYEVALYHLRYAVSEVKRLRVELADAQRADRSAVLAPTQPDTTPEEGQS